MTGRCNGPLNDIAFRSIDESDRTSPEAAAEVPGPEHTGPGPGRRKDPCRTGQRLPGLVRRDRGERAGRPAVVRFPSQPRPGGGSRAVRPAAGHRGVAYFIFQTQAGAAMYLFLSYNSGADRFPPAVG